jgi:hypothetical protein
VSSGSDGVAMCRRWRARCPDGAQMVSYRPKECQRRTDTDLALRERRRLGRKREFQGSMNGLRVVIGFVEGRGEDRTSSLKRAKVRLQRDSGSRKVR